MSSLPPTPKYCSAYWEKASLSLRMLQPLENPAPGGRTRMLRRTRLALPSLLSRKVFIH